ncbi:hypothetical protein [Paraflavitalea sp. CAU 1676]|uniref:hypothetical protein n=1 Tax=Paraflavitalea sp. CAU 1676 TaxID=3032598 RepID=UPI0023DCA1DA|nr:hypothetical protein [Paraflavitalea sp. CAU 1676]MDF2193475.1 hypothetical protein [Paraflavitalea sp. CAU 1676]
MKYSYPLKQWLLTLLAGPLVHYFVTVLFATRNQNRIEFHEIYLIVLIVSLVLSLPAFLIYCLIYQALEKGAVPAVVSKTLLTCFSIISIAATLGLTMGEAFSTLTLAYSIVAVITGVVFDIKSNTEPAIDQLAPKK